MTELRSHFGFCIASYGRYRCITQVVHFVDLSRRGHGPLTVCESPKPALGFYTWRCRQEFWLWLGLDPFVGSRGLASYLFSLASLPTSRGRDALLQAGLVSPHVGRGMSTIYNRTILIIRAQVQKQSLKWSNCHSCAHITPVVQQNYKEFQTNQR
jgi:hypothetical protein